MKMTADLEFQVLKTQAELEEFARGYAHAFSQQRLKSLHGVRVEELSRYTYVFGAYKNGELVAGYVVNAYPDRCFEDVPIQTRERVVRELGGEGRICEVVAIWKSPSLSSVYFAKNVWPRIIMDTVKMGRPYIFGCAYKGHGLQKRYRLLDPRMVREGRHDNDLDVFVYTRTQFVASFLVNAASFAIRALVGKNTRLKANAGAV